MALKIIVSGLDVRFLSFYNYIIYKLILPSEFAHGKVDPHEAGKQGGHASAGSNTGGEAYKPTEHGGQKKDGGVDGRIKQ